VGVLWGYASDFVKVIWVQLAAGRGQRLGGTPKQFRRLGQKPILVYAAETFLATYPEGFVVAVLSLEQYHQGKRLLEKVIPPSQLLLVIGGAERQDSTAAAIAQLKALELLSAQTVVAFHDAARPLVSSEVIGRTIEAAWAKGAAVCGLPVSFSLRRLTESGSEAVPRRFYWEVQTPQAIRGDILLAAYEKFPPNAHADFTDEGSWIEAAGYPVLLVAGHPHNLKITYETDLLLARLLLRSGRRP